MKLGVVIGNVVSTRKVESVSGLKMLVVSYLNGDLVDTRKTAVCLDTVGAGSGDVVLLCSSSSARLTAATRNAVTDNTIVGIVEAISSGGTTTYSKHSDGT
ncbi:MAG: Ethanolamine utilization protein EutN/carboxysome structural protein Ccml [Bacteroidetes bacterium]|jgi:microcompartment protein CcmK/EutM|nr:Ethanolamine utilization protein EutN/carboxysome structural protein Ccml [Bacteroidota bacterium]